MLAVESATTSFGLPFGRDDIMIELKNETIRWNDQERSERDQVSTSVHTLSMPEVGRPLQ
jgi:hypothetical protein